MWPTLTLENGSPWVSERGHSLKLAWRLINFNYIFWLKKIFGIPHHKLPQGYDSCLEVIEYADIDDLKKHLIKGDQAVVLVNETNDFDLPVLRFNTKAVLNQIDYQRRNKTAYEQACIRRANQLAVPIM